MGFSDRIVKRLKVFATCSTLAALYPQFKSFNIAIPFSIPASQLDTFYFRYLAASAATVSGEKPKQSVIDTIGSLIFSPGHTNNGQTKSSTLKLVSRTSLRIVPVVRNLRILIPGKPITTSVKRPKHWFARIIFELVDEYKFLIKLEKE
jgi:hypothetical protein